MGPLSADEEAFLELVVAHPDTPVTEVYQQFGASKWKGAQLRQALVAKGYLVEVETRLGKGGRAAKFLLPSFVTMERRGLVPPDGRGGPIHRHVQRLVAAEGTAKGYTTEVEHALPSGDAVDVHLAKDGATTAVEIWVGSRLSRELEHVANCLAAGYDQIVCLVFADDARDELAQALPERFGGEAARVTALPLHRLGNLLPT